MSLRLLTGGEAVAYAMRQIDPDVVPAYPITPQTPIIQGYAKFVADGVAHGELIDVESEHSAMSAAIGAALAGARTMTATSSQGLALMTEVVRIETDGQTLVFCGSNKHFPIVPQFWPSQQRRQALLCIREHLLMRSIPIETRRTASWRWQCNTRV